MAVSAQSIVKDAQVLLKDLEGTRWSASQLVESLNRGLLELAELRPDATAKTVPVPLAQGARQAVPADCMKLMEITSNTGGASIRQVDRDLLDRVEPGWRNRQPSRSVAHFMFDEREPNAYLVYPPAVVGIKVDMTYSAAPVPLPVPDDTDTTFSAVTGDIPVQDIFASALLAYVLYRSYAKDADYGSNSAQAVANYQLFKSLLTGDTEARMKASPGVADHPTA